jgi:hypothetical protein
MLKVQNPTQTMKLTPAETWSIKIDWRSLVDDCPSDKELKDAIRQIQADALRFAASKLNRPGIGALTYVWLGGQRLLLTNMADALEANQLHPLREETKPEPFVIRNPLGDTSNPGTYEH